MKLQSANNTKAGAFTLIEMIGVLAVIAILAALLIPKVFTAISNARVNNACVSVETVKTALADHYAKYGSIPVDGSTTPNPTTLTPGQAQALQFDAVLLREGFLDKPFMVKIGDGVTGQAGTRIEVLNAPASTVTAATTGDDGTFNLNGAAGNANSVNGSVVVQAVITGVTEADARDLSERIDGTTMTSAIGTQDLSGRVKYAPPATGASTTTVYVYITHR